MTKSTYLSVDLDYWWRPGMRNSLLFIKDLLSLGRQVTVFTEHHLVLREINRQYKKVYNIDYHSDIIEPCPGWPECGSWVNHVPFRKDAEFEWRFPSWKECVYRGNGLCHKPRRDNSRSNPFVYNNMHSWKSVSRKQGIENIDLDDVDKISLVLSPEWSIGEYIFDTLCYLLAAKEDGVIDFYGKRTKPLIKRMLKEGWPIEHWR